MGPNCGRLLLTHSAMGRFMLMANGSKPSCRPQMVKKRRLETSWPRLRRPAWSRARLQTGTKPGGSEVMGSRGQLWGHGVSCGVTGVMEVMGSRGQL